MAFLSGNIKSTNAVFLLALLPIMLRLWIEAVVWRLERGPQMIFFSLMHGDAGLLTPVLIASLLAIYVYWLWVAVIIVRWLIPKFRSTIHGVAAAFVGGVTVFAFFETGTFLQTRLADTALYATVALMSLLGLVALGLITVGVRDLRKKTGVAA
jgi:hypothetical protein